MAGYGPSIWLMGRSVGWLIEWSLSLSLELVLIQALDMIDIRQKYGVMVFKQYEARLLGTNDIKQ